MKSYLPQEFQRPSTTIAPITAGLSGAGVYRVEAGGQRFVLKVWDASIPAEAWRRIVDVQRAAARSGVAPDIVHEDEARRALLSVFVQDSSFPTYYGNPTTRAASIAELGGMLRRVHGLPLRQEAVMPKPLALLESNWATVSARATPPSFARDTVERVLSEAPPASEHAAVLSHNDVNPGNILFDGERLLLVDWDHAGPNDPYFDLATISVFLNMNEGTGQRLVAAYEGNESVGLPARFRYDQRLVAAMAGSKFLELAIEHGYVGATTGETLDSTLSLGEFYTRMRAGTVSLGAAEGQWLYGLALLEASARY